MSNDQVVLNQTVMNFNTPNKNGRIYLPGMKLFGYQPEIDNDKINEWIVQCLQTELGKRQNEFTYLNSLTASQIASLKDHASAVVTLEAYIRCLKEMIEKYGGRFNGNF